MICRVAYLLAADNVSGPVLTRLRGVNQPVIRTGNEFSSPRPALLASIWAHVHRSTPRLSTAPLVPPSAAAATAARGTGAPLSTSTHDPSSQPPSLACTAATPWPSPTHWWAEAR